MIEIQWGQPVALVLPHDGEIERFSTIEKVRYWLRRRWPVSDAAQDTALAKVESAMDCMSPVEEARRAFLVAALTAGFEPTDAL